MRDFEEKQYLQCDFIWNLATPHEKNFEILESKTSKDIDYQEVKKKKEASIPNRVNSINHNASIFTDGMTDAI